MKNILVFLFLICILSCKDDHYIAEGNYINPPIDSVSFGYRISDIYYFDTSNVETHINFKLDTGISYFWSEVAINKNGFQRLYIPEYTNGQLTKLIDMSGENEDVFIDYEKIPNTAFNYLCTAIKYNRINSSFALTFEYDSNTRELMKIQRCQLNPNGSIGNVTESIDFCQNINLGACSDRKAEQFFTYGADFNSLYKCKEILPFIFILIKPQQESLADILAFLPYYFSKNLAISAIRYKQGKYEYGFNKKETSFLYFKPTNSGFPEGFNFSMRIY